MKGWKVALLCGGAVVIGGAGVIGTVVLTSGPKNPAEFETAAGTPGPAAGPAFIDLPAFAVQVRLDGGESAIDYLSVRLMLGETQDRGAVCHQLPKIADVFNMTVGRQALSQNQWRRITNAASAESLAKHFNKALDKAPIDSVQVRHGRKAPSPEGSCTR